MLAAMAATGLDLLGKWAAAAERWWQPVPGRTELGYYGTGYSHWGVQTNQKYVGAMAALFRLGSGPAAAHAKGRALSALRYTLDTHLTGGLKLADGGVWGHTWISVLGLERMLYGVRLLADALTVQDREDLQRVLCSEANWLAREHVRANRKGVFGSRWAHEGANAPESNLWNGAFLWRMAVHYPEQPEAAEWREMALRFLINSVSIPEDAVCEALVDGKPVRERFAGPNFFSHFALDHHGYLNVGYMMICVSNAAMLHFDLKAANLPRPEALDWHEADLWRVLRRMVFGDGRLARIGGDSRVRYCYCQDYLAPAALYAADRLGDGHAAGLIERYLAWAAQEQNAAQDGSFFGARLREMAASNPYYYTRLESDRACALGMLAAYAPLVAVQPKPAESLEVAVAGGWIEPEHSVALHRSPTRLAAFSWRAYGLGQGMCQPPDDGHLADWQQNLGGLIQVASDEETGKPHRRVVEANVAAFDGGFIAAGAIMEGVDTGWAEGWRGTDAVLHHSVFAALPDGHSVVGLSHATVQSRTVWLRSVMGLHALLPNDLFNAYERTLHTEIGTAEFTAPAPAEALIALGSRWACLDGKLGWLGLYGGEGLYVHRVPCRRGGKYRSLYTEVLGWPARTGLWPAQPGEVVLDCGWLAAASIGTAQMRGLAQANASSTIAGLPHGVRGVRVRGLNGKDYIVIANFNAIAVTLDSKLNFGECTTLDVITGSRLTREIVMPASGATLLQLQVT